MLASMVHKHAISVESFIGLKQMGLVGPHAFGSR